MYSHENIAISVIIPAWNEAAFIEHTLTNLQRVLAEIDISSEIIVADNDSSDDTAAIAQRCGARIIHEPRRHIARARNAGASIARGKFLFFIDADTWPTQEHFTKALAQLQQENACGGGFALVFDDQKPGPHRVFIRFWNVLSVRFRVAAGCFFFCTREAFDAVNGFSTKHYAGEEVYFSHSLRRWGRKNKKPFVVMAKPLILTSSRKLEWFAAWQHLMVIFMVGFFPFTLRSRKLSWFWYKRPKNIK